MTTYQTILSFISATFFTIGVFYFLRFLLVTRSVDKFLHFAISILGCSAFALFELLLSHPLSPEQVLLFHRLKLAAMIMAMVFWFFCSYEIFFDRSRVPKIFLLLGLLVAMTIPFSFFLHLPVSHLQVVFLGIRFDYRFASQGPGYLLLGLFVFGTYAFSVLKALRARLNWRDRGLAILTFLPGIVAGINDFAVSRGERSGILIAEYVVFGYLIATFSIYFIEEQRNHRHLKIINAELERRVGERTAELYAANAELSAANEELRRASLQKSELMSIAARDLKNPLQAILGYSELIMGVAGNDERIRRQSEVIHRSSERMLLLIDELLESAALESGEVDLQPRRVDLGALARRVAENSEEAAAAKDQRIELSDEGNCHVKADELRLQEIVENLVNNAVKFSPPGTTIRVRTATSGPWVKLEVEDEGLGLSREEQDSLFNRYKHLNAGQVGSETATGLGLYIVKKLVELQGGGIGVQSEPGRGSTFTVIFPRTS